MIKSLLSQFRSQISSKRYQTTKKQKTVFPSILLVSPVQHQIRNEITHKFIHFSMANLKSLIKLYEIYKQFQEMIFDKDLEQQMLLDQIPSPEFKYQLSTYNTNGKISSLPSFTPFSPLPNSTENSFNQFETSLDKELHRHNALLAKKAILAYLKQCLTKIVDDAKAFEDGNIFCFQSLTNSQTEQEGIQSEIINSNPFLTAWQRKSMNEVFNKYEELRSYFREVRDSLGKSITQELVCIFQAISKGKLGSIQEIQRGEIDQLIPKIQRFWGDNNDETIIKDSWSVYCDTSYDQVRRIAKRDTDSIGSTLYFSNKLKYLSLQQINPQLIKEVNLTDKFGDLIAFLSSNLLLAMLGISQRDEELDNFINELKFDCSLSVNIQEELHKKIKSE